MSRMTDQIGRVLSGRYRLLAPIGTGASAQVFLADDTRLRRRVAVKVLHAALADDDAFLRRFRAEAQAAAALNHPNVMAVYDWGEDDGPFLVTEYLGGGNLRAMLDRGTRLAPAQALLVGLEATRGLEYAHRRGFVHRDIKPANLLFGEEGRLRIADFGLARALAEAAWTEPAGAVLGTARYASPEQARGEPVDGRGDVYSLALVLVEAVTGDVPFAADTTIGTLMGRVDRPLEVPEALGPLRRPLERAGRPDPRERPDASELAAGLMASAADLDRPAPLPLAGATVDDVDLTVVDRDPTLLPGRGDDTVAVVDFERLEPEQRGLTRRERRQIRREQRDDGRRRRRWPWVVLALLVVLGLAGVAAWGAVESQQVPTQQVPALIGFTEEEATAQLRELGLQVDRREDYFDNTVPGQVQGQDPDAGVELEEGATVLLVVSLGPPLVGVPADLVGRPLPEAEITLAGVGLAVGEVERRHDEEVPADVVLAVPPDLPAQLPKGSTVNLVVSDGPVPRTVPDGLVGLNFDEAAARLAGVQLDAVREEVFDDTAPPGQVMNANPESGASVPRGTDVVLTVSKGPELVPVPDVTGLAATEAAARLEGAGFVVDSVQGSPNGQVVATEPPANEPVRKGSGIVILSRR